MFSDLIYPVYVDESYGEHTPILSVAGYIFEPSKAKQLSVEWANMLACKSLPYFHMTDCNKERGVFSHLTEPECVAVATEAINLTKKYSEQGFVVSVHESFYEQHFPAVFRKEIGSAYTFCLRECLTMTRRWANRTGFDGRFAFFFERGHKHAQEAERIINSSYGAKSEVRNRFRFHSAAFIDKKDAAPIQCADILAWHAYVAYRRILGGQRPRKDLLALLRERDMAMNLTPEQLRRMAMHLVRRFGRGVPYASGEGAAGAMP